MIYQLKRSNRKAKKYMLISPDGRRVHFGQDGAEDYPIHKDTQRKMNYINRHKKREQKYWSHTKNNLMRPSYLSRWVTWHKPDLAESVKDIERLQKVKIDVKI